MQTHLSTSICDATPILYPSPRWIMFIVLILLKTFSFGQGTNINVDLTPADIGILILQNSASKPVLSGTILTLPVCITNLSGHEVTIRDVPPYRGVFLYGIASDGSQIPLYPFNPVHAGAESHVEFTSIEPHKNLRFDLSIPVTAQFAGVKEFRASIDEIVWDDLLTRKRHREIVFSEPFEIQKPLP